MVIWSILCFLGACGGMMRVANSNPGGNMNGAEAVGASIGLFFWLLIWFFPVAGMGIIALVTRPKPDSNISGNNVPTSLCPHCGKYFAGKADFCPYCGESQRIEQQVGAASN
jgi:hypothetical protein